VAQHVGPEFKPQNQKKKKRRKERRKEEGGREQGTEEGRKEGKKVKGGEDGLHWWIGDTVQLEVYPWGWQRGPSGAAFEFGCHDGVGWWQGAVLGRAQGDQDTRGRGAGQHMAHRQCWSWGSLWTLGTGQLGSKLSSAEGHYGHGWDFLEMFRGSQPLLDLLLVHVPPRA
jgi:hypothetical protein